MTIVVFVLFLSLAACIFRRELYSTLRVSSSSPTIFTYLSFFFFVSLFVFSGALHPKTRYSCKVPGVTLRARHVKCFYKLKFQDSSYSGLWCRSDALRGFNTKLSLTRSFFPQLNFLDAAELHRAQQAIQKVLVQIILVRHQSNLWLLNCRTLFPISMN